VRSAAPGERELRGKANFCPEIHEFLATTGRADQSLCYGLRAPERSGAIVETSGNNLVRRVERGKGFDYLRLLITGAVD
jgi:hypothetical protein